MGDSDPTRSPSSALDSCGYPASRLSRCQMLPQMGPAAHFR